MNPSTSLRRAAVIAVAGAALVLPACASAKSGTAVPGGTSPSAARTFAEVPKHAARQAAARSPFCTASAALGDLGRTVPANDAGWDRLADNAPVAIRSDVRLVAGYVDSLATGQPDVTAAPRLASSLAHIATWISAHCE